MTKKWGFPDQWSLEEKVSKREDKEEKRWKMNKRVPGAWSKAEAHKVGHQRHLCRVDIGTRGKAALPQEGEELIWLQERWELNSWGLSLSSLGFVVFVLFHLFEKLEREKCL